jgi:glucose/arabinose dehydrogenase
MKNFKFHANTIRWIVLLIVLIPGSGCSTDHDGKQTLEGDPENGGITLPEGFTALVVADSLGFGRHLVVNHNGDIYLALRQLNNGKGIVCLRDENGNGRADVIRYFNDFPGTGIDLHKGYLYFASDEEVMRYPLQESELVPESSRELIASGFPEQNQHRAKIITFDNDGNMYVNVGAPSNACMENTRTPGSPGLDPCPQLERQAGIWQFKDDVPDQTQLENGYRYSTGIRNAVALEWNDVVDELYLVQHGRDQLSQFFPEFYSEDEGVNLPSEEFFLVEEGSDFGWPYCYYDHYKGKRVLAPEYGGDGEITGRCESTTDPIMGFPAHVAPNDLLFYDGNMFPERYKNGAFIAFHGSWNRAPQEQEGYYVVFVPFEGAYPSGDWEIFADGFAGKEVVMSPGDAVHRPMGLAQGPDGSLYVSDSRRGKIWRILYVGD